MCQSRCHGPAVCHHHGVCHVCLCVCVPTVPRRRRCVTVCHGVPRRCVVPVCGCGCGSPAGTATHWQLGVGGTGGGAGPGGPGTEGGGAGPPWRRRWQWRTGACESRVTEFRGPWLLPAMCPFLPYSQHTRAPSPCPRSGRRYQCPTVLFFKFLNFWFFFESRL